jgi:hypothetical protein
MEVIKRVEDHRASQSSIGKYIMESIKWMCEFAGFADVALVQYVYNADPDRIGWQRQMNRENKAMLAARLYELLGEREDRITELEDLGIQGLSCMSELRGRSAWLKYVNQLLDILSEVAQNPAAQLIDIQKRTLLEGLKIPVTAEAMDLAEAIMSKAEESGMLRLREISEAIYSMLGRPEVCPVSSILPRILRSHIVTHAFPWQTIRCISKIKAMEEMKTMERTERMERAERIERAKYYEKMQLKCCQYIITATRWICGLERTDAIALIRHICDTKPGRFGRQRQMSRELVIRLYELLGEREDRIPDLREIGMLRRRWRQCTNGMSGSRGMSAWEEAFQPPVMFTAVSDPATRLIELLAKTLREELAIPVANYAAGLAKLTIKNAGKDIEFHLKAIHGSIGRILGSIADTPEQLMIKILALHVTAHTSQESKESIMEALEEIRKGGNNMVRQLLSCKDVIIATRWICGLEHPAAIALIRQIDDAEPYRRPADDLEDKAMLAIRLYELLGVMI